MQRRVTVCKSVEAWVARISCTDRERKQREAKEGECNAAVGVNNHASYIARNSKSIIKENLLNSN